MSLKRTARIGWLTRVVWLMALVCMAPTVTRALDCSAVDFRGTRATVCRVDLRKDRLKLFLRDSSGAPFTSFAKVAKAVEIQGEQLAFAMNAGMYRTDYSPVGLLVIDGHQEHRLNLATGYGNFYLKPNGVFLVSSSGARIVESAEYRSLDEPAILATQSGPLLVQGGRIHPELNPEGTSRLIRNGVGVVSAQEIVFAISEDPVKFYDFALLFRDALKCSDALYLDGNVSSVYIRSSGRDDQHVPLGPVFGVTMPRR